MITGTLIVVLVVIMFLPKPIMFWGSLIGSFIICTMIMASYEGFARDLFIPVVIILCFGIPIARMLSSK